MFKPFIDSFIEVSLLHPLPDLNQPLFQFADIIDLLLI